MSVRVATDGVPLGRPIEPLDGRALEEWQAGELGHSVPSDSALLPNHR